jgi:hypothetical protein
MTIGELVLAYGAIASALVLALAVVLIRRKSTGKQILQLGKQLLTLPSWRLLLGSPGEKLWTGAIWLKMFLAAFIALCAGVIIIVFVLPHGTAWALISLLTCVVLLVLLAPKLLE